MNSKNIDPFTPIVIFVGYENRNFVISKLTRSSNFSYIVIFCFDVLKVIGSCCFPLYLMTLSVYSYLYYIHLLHINT